MKDPAKVVSLTVFASLFVACAGQLEHARSQNVVEAEPIMLVCESLADDAAANRNHFLRARRIVTSRSATNREVLSCLAQHQSAN
jgi:hypothetical protein